MPDEELIGQLNRLRARAGNPSVRELAQLTMRQGPGRAMSRSTVQDKISGKSPPRLGQILALVRACADYAKSIGAPLDVQDTDEQVWRERAQAALVRTPASPAPVATTASPSPRWDLEPLIRAGLHDMVELVQASEREPTANWLPTLIEALGSAGMSNEQFLRAASGEQAQQVVGSILALAASQAEQAADRLIYLSAVNQRAEDIPVIIVLLRRQGGAGTGTELAGRLIDAITGKRLGSPGDIGLDDYLAIVRALRSATMDRDATRVLEGIGQHGRADLVLELATSFPDTLSGDRETVLSSVAKGGNSQLSSLLRALQTTALDGIDPEKTVDRIIFGIHPGTNPRVASYLESEGLHKEAQRVLELEGKPPF